MPLDEIFGVKSVDIIELYVYILSLTHGKIVSHHLLC